MYRPYTLLYTFKTLYLHSTAVQHERGPRNSTIRKQMALYLKESAAAATDVSSPMVAAYSPHAQTMISPLGGIDTYVRHAACEHIRVCPARRTVPMFTPHRRWETDGCELIYWPLSQSSHLVFSFHTNPRKPKRGWKENSLVPFIY